MTTPSSSPLKPRSLGNPFSPALSQPTVEDTFAKLLNSMIQRGLHYHRKTINLDGLTFEECSFENCKFITKTGNFVLRNCRLMGPETVFLYEGSALKAVRLYEFMNSCVAGKIVFPTIFPQMDKDQRVTIE